MTFSIADIEFLVKLVVSEKLDSLSVGDLVIKKSLHTGKSEEKPTVIPKLTVDQYFTLPPGAEEVISPRKRNRQGDQE